MRGAWLRDCEKVQICLLAKLQCLEKQEGLSSTPSFSVSTAIPLRYFSKNSFRTHQSLEDKVTTKGSPGASFFLLILIQMQLKHLIAHHVAPSSRTQSPQLPCIYGCKERLSCSSSGGGTCAPRGKSHAFLWAESRGTDDEGIFVDTNLIIKK